MASGDSPSLLDLRHVHIRNLLLPEGTLTSDQDSLNSSSSSIFLATRPTRQRTVSTASRSSAASSSTIRRASRGGVRYDEQHSVEGGAESTRMARLAARRRLGEAKVVLCLPGSSRRVELKASTERRTHHQWSVGEEIWPAEAVAASALGVELWLRSSEKQDWSKAWSREAELEQLRSIKLDALDTSRLPCNTLILSFAGPGTGASASELHFLLPAQAGVAEDEAVHELEQGAEAEPPSSSASSSAAAEEDGERQGGKKSAPLAQQQQQQKERPKANRATSDVFARSMRETRMVAGYEQAELEALLKLQQEREEVVEAFVREQARIDDELGPESAEMLHLQCGELKERVRVLDAQRDVEREDAKAARAVLARRKEALARRRARLETARRISTSERQDLANMEKQVETMTRKSGILARAIYARRASLLRSLEVIYPIELLDASSLLFSIVSVPLPNSSRPDEHDSKAHEYDDDTTSSALGLVAQLVALLSAYLDTPIHYPVATAGSRAVVRDAISIMSGPRAFPLYAKGVEHYRYEYAVFLLNKDIEQLMNVHAVTVLDIRHTLANLKNLIVTLTADQPRRSKRPVSRVQASEMISLPSSSRSNTHPAKSLGLGPAPTAERAAEAVEQALTISAAEKRAQQVSAASTAASWTTSLLGWRTAASPAPAPASATATTGEGSAGKTAQQDQGQERSSETA